MQNGQNSEPVTALHTKANFQSLMCLSSSSFKLKIIRFVTILLLFEFILLPSACQSIHTTKVQQTKSEQQKQISQQQFVNNIVAITVNPNSDNNYIDYNDSNNDNDNDNAHYNQANIINNNNRKLTEIEMEIEMNKQMIVLYTQRLKVLIQLRQEMLSDRIKQQKLEASGLQQENVVGAGSGSSVGSSKKVDSHYSNNHNNKQHFTPSVVPKSKQKSNDYHHNSNNGQQSPYYLLTNRYQIPISQNKQQQSSPNNDDDIIRSQSKQQLSNDQDIVILPPFVINRQSAYVTVIAKGSNNNLWKLDDQDDQFIQQSNSKYQNIPQPYYSFSHATRLLFYHVETLTNYRAGNDKVEINKNSQQYQHNRKTNSQEQNSHQQTQRQIKSNENIVEQRQTQKYILHLTLEIKPNKIKTVQITCCDYKFVYGEKNNTQTFGEKSIQSQFKIQEQVTSYESNPLISQNFQWHKALEFDNLIVGYDSQWIRIKSKSKEFSHEIHINDEDILGVYSLNQYKVVYITEKSIGTVNVRSGQRQQEIRFEYYLGNRTQLMMAKNKQKHQADSQQNQQYMHNGKQQEQQMLFKSDRQQKLLSFWDPIHTRRYQKVRAVAWRKIPKGNINNNNNLNNQMLVLLSNGDMLMYGNGKINHSVNLGIQLMRELAYFYSLNEGGQQQSQQQQQNKQPKNKIMKLSITLLPNLNHAIIHSNKHPKILIYNITIPGLTMNKNSGFLMSLISPTENQLTFRYWMGVKLEKVGVRGQQDQNAGYYGKGVVYDKNSNQRHNVYFNQKDIDIHITVRHQHHQSHHTNSATTPSNTNTIFVYFAYYDHINEQTIDRETERRIRTNKKLVIQQHRLLISELVNSGGGNRGSLVAGGNAGEGRSYWWNVLMVAMIVVGVIVFKKCKSTSNNGDDDDKYQRLGKTTSSAKSSLLQKKQQKPTLTRKQLSSEQQQQLYYQLPQGYNFNSKTKNINNNNLNKLEKQRDTQLRRQQQNSQRSRERERQKVQYEESVLNQLQAYLEKQGQRLSKQQLEQLILDIEDREDDMTMMGQKQQQPHHHQQKQQQHQPQQQSRNQTNKTANNNSNTNNNKTSTNNKQQPQSKKRR